MSIKIDGFFKPSQPCFWSAAARRRFQQHSTRAIKVKARHVSPNKSGVVPPHSKNFSK
jgi:hypothetical protein